MLVSEAPLPENVPPVTVPENDGESTVTTAAPDPAPSAMTKHHELDAGIVALPPEPCVMITRKPPVVWFFMIHHFGMVLG
ncbi:hypothetical protein, partial [Streptococcus pneumoniae]|uniref:hypothetical protein n=1 Tax=Streptococcus pneumoniae TaxID=1313 RepID=UPI001E42644D